MLIEFRLANFRSFRDEQILSMVAGPGAELREFNVFDPGVVGVPALLRSAAIFGPNAAGKSNLIHAMRFMSEFVATSSAGSKPDALIGVTPFLLDEESRQQPTELEATFVAKGVRYQYGFSVSTERVHEEWLFAAPEGRSQTWFQRKLNQGTGETDWYFGPSLKGQKKIIQTSTRRNALFLSTAAQLNSEQLYLVWNWFAQRFHAFPGKAPISEYFTTKLCEDEEARNEVIRFMARADLGIDDLRVERKEFTEEDLPDDMPQELRKHALSRLREQNLVPTFFHRFSGEKSRDRFVAFPLNEESAGTQYIYSWAGPWLDVLRNGYLLALDELDSSLHSLLAGHLIRFFHDPNINRKGAQLVFSTHSVPIMSDKTLLRRDQVWFVSKNAHQVSRLDAFSDFSPRKGEDRGKNYLGGKYGAIPYLHSSRQS